MSRAEELQTEYGRLVDKADATQIIQELEEWGWELERERDTAIARAEAAETKLARTDALEKIADEALARAEKAEAAARVLAHAWDHDSKPPDWAVEAGRGYLL